MRSFTLESLDTRSPIAVRSEYDELCRQWILQVLVELGGHRATLHDGHVSETQMLEFVGLDLAGPDREYSQPQALAALKALHRHVSEHPAAWPADSPAAANIHWLGQALGLSFLEQRLLLLCVLARSNYPLGQAFETLGGLSNLQLISVLCTLLDASAEEITRALRPEGDLARTGLAKLDNNSHFSFSGKIDLLEGIAERLLLRHGHCFDVFADNFVQAPAPTLRLEQYPHLQPLLDYVQAYLSHCLQTGQTGVNLLFYGPPGTGKTQLVRALAQGLGASLFEVATSRSEGHRIAGAQRLAAYALSQRILAQRGHTVIAFDEIEDIDEAISDDDESFSTRRPTGRKGWFNQLLETNPVPAIWVSNRIRQIDTAHRRRFDIHLHVDVPPAPIRTKMLESHVLALGASSRWCEQTARHEGLGPALMERTARVAGAVLTARSQAAPEAVLENLMGASLRALGEHPVPRDASPEALSYDASLISTSIDPEALAAGLLRSRAGRLLFAGPPGTGKTALALHLARVLGRPVLLKRGSDLLGSFVGESERAIAQAFERARQDGAVLVIDEADTFLGSRQSATRSWEVSMVNEFLQQMEDFESGFFVATTNLMERLDEASLRRFDAKITFAYLRRAQAATLFRRACDHLGLEAGGCEQLVAGLDRLTPGDFAAVMRQACFAPVGDAGELARRLRDEMRHKRDTGRSIGFVAEMP